MFVFIIEVHQYGMMLMMIVFFMPSVLWRCWLGIRKSIRPVKKSWVMRYRHRYLS